MPRPHALATTAETLAAVLDERRQDLVRRAGLRVRGEQLDAATQEKLRQLGY